MNEEDRPDAQELLEIIKREEKSNKRGKLKIFLGMAAGVGKTYAMLEAAQKLKAEGVDVIIGALDTHGRMETAKLMENLEVIPEKFIKYKDVVFKELDLDNILKRKPQLVLVDELAHSNVPGSRHPKRWQDVVEILDNGIDVLTTLNVQHIESLKDVVEKITGITIRETVPDIMIETSAFIELVDLTPSELLKRMKEGKVYLGEQSQIAAQNFFQEDRLTALREIILRYAAEKIDHDLQGMFSSVERLDAWKPRERLLVAVSHSPHSQKLIRITRRLAFNLDAPWIAVHVDDGKVLDEEEQETLAKNLTLARDLGAEVITTSAPDIAQAIQRIARQKSVSQIIIGRPPRNFFVDLFYPNTLMDHLARECSDLDLHVIRQTMIKKRKWGLKLPGFLKNFSSYLLTTVFVAFSAGLTSFFLPYIDYKVAGFVFSLCLMGLSLFFRKEPIFFASILYLLIWFFMFIPIEDAKELSYEDMILLPGFFLLAVFTVFLTDRSKKNRELLIKHERSIEALYDIVQKIAGAPSFEEALKAVKDKLSFILGGKYDIAIGQIDRKLVFNEENSSLFENEKEQAAAQWVFQNGKEAGFSTSTLPLSKNFYIPLKGKNEIVGVLAHRSKSGKELSAEEKNFLYTVAQQLAHYLERSLSEERERNLKHAAQVEKTYQSILSLIENLFEGPLLNMQDAVKELKHTQTVELSNSIIHHPIERLENSSDSLKRILENIAAMVNLSSGLIPIKRTPQDIKKLINSCLEHIRASTTNYQWEVQLEDVLPEVSCDPDLIELLLYNLAFHAMEFSLPNTPIRIEAKRAGDYLTISISAEGQSIPPDIMDVAFEKLYRMPAAKSNSGLGLGLEIAKTIAEIHDGKLNIQNHPNGGMIFALFLPI